jgi:hypothetical protein
MEDGWDFDNAFGNEEHFGASFRKWSDSLVLDDFANVQVSPEVSQAVGNGGVGMAGGVDGWREGGPSGFDLDLDTGGFTAAAGNTAGGYGAVPVDSPSASFSDRKLAASSLVSPSAAALLSPMSPAEFQKEVKRVANEQLAEMVKAQVQQQVQQQVVQAQQGAREWERSATENEMKRTLEQKNSESEGLRRRIADLEKQQQHDLETFQQRLSLVGGKIQTRTPISGPPTPATEESKEADGVLEFDGIEGSLQNRNGGSSKDCGGSSGSKDSGAHGSAGGGSSGGTNGGSRGGSRNANHFDDVDLSDGDRRKRSSTGGEGDSNGKDSAKEKIRNCTSSALEQIERCTNLTIKKLKQCVSKEGTHATGGGGGKRR